MSKQFLLSPDWTSAYGSVKIQWENHTIGFDCPCGATELQLSDDTSEHTCERCGRRYWLGIYFKVNKSGMRALGISTEGAAWAMEGTG